MSWNAEQGGGWTHTGTTGEVWTFSTKQGGTGAVVAQMHDPAKPVGIRIYGSPLLDSCWEVITTSGTGGDIIIRKVSLGTPAGASDTGAHGLTTGDAYTIEVRWINGKISVYLNGSTTAVVEFQTTAYQDFSTIGFYSATDGAALGSFKLYDLVRTFSTLADVAWWVCNGTLYATDSGRGGAKVIGQFFDPSARIFHCEGKQHAYIFDGSKAVDFDSVTMTADSLTLSAGTLPGQSALNTPPGACTGNAAAFNNERLLIASGNTVYASAIGFGSPNKDFDITSDALGKAFVLPAQVGQPLNSLYVAERNRLLFGSKRALWDLSGDPTIGADVGNLSQFLGTTGPFSAVLAETGLTLMHTNEGACIIPSGGGIRHLSRDVLTDVIQQPAVAGIPMADLLLISMAQDIQRHGVWIFMTPIDGVSSGRHLFYDTRIGAFEPGPSGGGWFPIDFADPDVQPTCCMEYLGEIVFGTRDGRMLFLDKDATSDAGTAFTTKITVNLMREDDQDLGILLSNIDLTMGLGSSTTTIKVLGGETPERAFLDPFQVWQGTLTTPRNSFPVFGSAAALVLRLESTNRIALEAVQIETQPALIIPTRRRTPPAPSPACQPPTPATPGAGDNTGGGPGVGEPDPETCTACATWMAANQTDTVGGEAAYRLAGLNTLTGAQAELSAGLAAFLGQNICDVPEDFNLYVTTDDAAFIDGPVITITDFLALDPGDYDPEDKTWGVWFRCADLVEP